MGWRTIVVNTHSKLTYKNNHLVFKNIEGTEIIHLSEIDILILETTNIVLTTMLLKRLVDENILVIFCDDKRLPIAKVLPYKGRHDSSLQIAKQIEWNREIKEKAWNAILTQKIRTQASVLKYKGYHSKSTAIWELSLQLKAGDPSNREGHASRIYFNTLFGSKFTRDQESAINAGLNYGYALIISMLAREIVINGCLTQVGINHINQFNSYNFASDLMEPFRPIIDQIVYDHQEEKFNQIKRALFTIFSETYKYNEKNMYLTNIVNDYTKKAIKFLNGEREEFPQFNL